jgi:stage IV sporulation protein B
MKHKAKRIFIFLLIFLSIASMPITSNLYTNEQKVQAATDLRYLPCGIPVGIYLKTDGLLVVGTSDIEDSTNQKVCPAKHILQSGDYITKVNQISMNTKEEFIAYLQKNKEKEIILTVRRNGKEIELKITPVLSKDNTYMLGIWIRDDSHGIGTLTYWRSDGQFGTLGHGISDVDTGELLEISTGSLYQAEISSVIKGQKGIPGSVLGSIDYQKNAFLGQIISNADTGVRGTGNEQLKNYIYESLKELYPSHSFEEMIQKYSCPIASAAEIEVGKAQIISAVSGKPEIYEIQILEVDKNNTGNKSMVIEVTDSKLLNLTNGILAGMSGSIICKNGKIIGAVTHVLVNNPHKGYGIFIKNML